ncbi:uncharacterized protein LOC128991373 [Macrosteles quadrilineatus]|uniref:uncharacterized protein LOC128991373 n=1 Tax=Macrosteles quadrilineatus TaxID=74068 RepID=UPI0023E24BF8|nr:uncharacterized protein LOC128991373 [Macrosteles quadrilineatus]
MTLSGPAPTTLHPHHHPSQEIRPTTRRSPRVTRMTIVGPLMVLAIHELVLLRSLVPGPDPSRTPAFRSPPTPRGSSPQVPSSATSPTRNRWSTEVYLSRTPPQVSYPPQRSVT